MYSENQIESAVAAGAISAEAASALRAHVQGMQHAPLADEENFRLISGFNDIFVAIAGILVLVGGGWVGGSLGVGGAAVAALAWGMAEYFTRQRRMALPSILFLLAFVGGIFAMVANVLGSDGSAFEGRTELDSIYMAVASACAAGAAWLHWRRFQVPITVAAGATALGGIVFFAVVAIFPALKDFAIWIAFLLGLALFACAMWWDMQDPARQTRKSDVAFWLHLAAAPMIVHPIFVALGVNASEPGLLAVIAVLATYFAIAAVALIVDRRALMVSALSYVMIAVIALVREFGEVSFGIGAAILIIGSGLLLLSAFWSKMRGILLPLVPVQWREKLPAVH